MSMSLDASSSPWHPWTGGLIREHVPAEAIGQGSSAIERCSPLAEGDGFSLERQECRRIPLAWVALRSRVDAARAEPPSICLSLLIGPSRFQTPSRAARRVERERCCAPSPREFARTASGGPAFSASGRHTRPRAVHVHVGEDGASALRAHLRSLGGRCAPCLSF